jgi:ATP/maltotriose-dependent transcriptional regulator MalT
LRLAQGQFDVAATAVHRALDEAPDRVSRLRLLMARVEILLAGGDVDTARGAADELAAMADDLDVPLLRAVATHAQGAVLLAAGEPRQALGTLRRAWRLWQALDVPYEGARARVLLGLACRALGDDESAEMEFDAARWVFRELGAVPDLATVESLTGREVTSNGGLTGRELEVLRLIAAGKSNRLIAADLFLSERTVARHVSNILRKLELPSRSAATAYAYEHALV